MKSACYICVCLLMATSLSIASQNSTSDGKYDSDLLSDFRSVDQKFQDMWDKFEELVLDKYGELQESSEDEFLNSVNWVNDYYKNITSDYEAALASFEYTYLNNTEENNVNYDFIYEVEEIVFEHLDDLDEAKRKSTEKMEDYYWEIIASLNEYQDDIEAILDIAETRSDDSMDTTETQLEIYQEALNQDKIDIEEKAYLYGEKIDDDLDEYYEEDEDSLDSAELAAFNELKNGISDVSGFDTLSSQDSKEYTLMMMEKSAQQQRINNKQNAFITFRNTNQRFLAL